MNENFAAAPVCREHIGVVVVTFHPVGEIEGRLQRMAAQGATLVVVDNGSEATARGQLETFCRRHGWELVANPHNLGLGTALNQGVCHLGSRGFHWVLLFDQDSDPTTDMSNRLIDTWQRHPAAQNVAVVGPQFHDRATGRVHRVLRPHPRWRGFFQKAVVADIDLLNVSMVITSGSLVRVADFERLGEFDAGFFVDYVDTDFCLRSRREGRLIAVSAAARLHHSLGNRKVHTWLGMKAHPTHHSALRHYYIARNRVPMLRRHAARELHWLWFECAATGLWLLRVIMFEPRKMAKLRAMVFGTWDGLRGGRGPCPPDRQRWLEGS